MAYRFDLDETLQAGCRRIGLSQIERATAELKATERATAVRRRDDDGNAARHIDNAVKVHVQEQTRGEQYLEQIPMSRIPGAFHCRWTRKWHTEKTYTIP